MNMIVYMIRVNMMDIYLYMYIIHIGLVSNIYESVNMGHDINT